MAPTLGTAALLVGFTWLFLANSWVSDDAYISFRVVENVVHGYGLTYNPPERVQAFTHPLWLMLHVVGYLVSGEVFYTTIAISFACCVASLAVGARHFGGRLQAATWILLVLSSKAFVDYTSSGLENPLTYLLIAIFFTRWLSDLRSPRAPDAERVRSYTLIASLAFLNRPDTILLFTPPLAWAALASRDSRRRVWTALIVGATPAILWELFSIVYYGFPLPNTYYAKVATGVPSSLLIGQGFAYVLNSLAYDPLTLGTIGAAGALAFASRRVPHAALGVGLLLALIYTVRVGGDHMAGRFFTAPFFLASLFLMSSMRDRRVSLALLAALALYNIAAPLSPFKTRPDYQQGWAWRDTNGIQDERGYYHRATNLMLYNPLTDRPDHEWFRQGLSFGRGAEPVFVLGSIGFFGYAAGPHKYVLDPNALSDPLLARLPASDNVYFDFYVGHFSRDIPEGYVASVAEGRNLLKDPLLHDLYDRVRSVTRGPLLSGERVRDIWTLNVGRLRRVHDVFNVSRRSRVFVPASHSRFRTDVGVRDYDRRELRARGDRSGYLVYGPGTPLRRGRYAVRWIGRYDETPVTSDFGFVEVWADGQEIARHDLRRGSAAAPDGTVAQIDFSLPESARRIDLRLFVNFGVRLVLEGVQIDGGPFEP